LYARYPCNLMASSTQLPKSTSGKCAIPRGSRCRIEGVHTPRGRRELLWAPDWDHDPLGDDFVQGVAVDRLRYVVVHSRLL